MIANPLFIVGTERSGSNLLRLLINGLPDITIPHPPHLMRDLVPVVGRYGPLSDEKNFRRLVQDAIELVRLHFAPWPLELQMDEVIRDAQTRDLYGAYASIYEQYRKHTGKARWGCKSTFMIHQVREVIQHHAEPQFIHLVRDVRDVAVSARRSVFCHYHPYHVAKLWAEEQRLALEWQNKLPSTGWLTLRYEDLIRRPAESMRTVCTFLGSEYSDELLKYFEKPAAKELSGLSRSWENVSKPVLKNNSEKFHRHLSVEEIQIIESVAHQEMKPFGYETASDPASLLKAPGSLDRALFRLEEEWLTLKEEGRALLKDRNAKFRLRKKAFLWTLGWR